MLIKNILRQKIVCVVGFAALFSSCKSAPPAEQPSNLGARFKTVQEAAQETKKAADSVQKLKTDLPFTPKTEQSPSRASNIPAPQTTEELPVYGSWLDRKMGKVMRVESLVQEGANQNFPIVLNLVLVKDDALYTTLTTITTRDWFRKDKPEIEALKKDKTNIQIREITILPEQQTYSYLVRVPSNVKAGLLFVRLIGNDNLYPTLFDPYEDIELQFSTNNFTMQQESDANKG